MRLALAVCLLLLLPSGFTRVRAQEAPGVIKGRILVNGVVDWNNSQAILLLPADISQPVETAEYMSLISVTGEFTVSGIEDGEYLVVLATMHVEPDFGGETVRFSNEVVRSVLGDDAPREFSSPAVRVTIADGRADREAVFEIGPLVRPGAAGALPTAGLGFESDAQGLALLPMALTLFGLLACLGGLALLRRSSTASG